MAKKKLTDLKPKKALPATEPVRPSLSVASALQAMNAGTATAMQQKLALKWIIESASMTYDWPYTPDQRETDIALGRQFVGQQIVGALKINLSVIEGADDANR